MVREQAHNLRRKKVFTQPDYRRFAAVFQLPVGMMPAFSTIRITVRCGARVRCIVPCGTTKPCPGASSTMRPSRSIGQHAFNHVEELVVLIVLVPVVFAFDNGHAHYRFIYLA